MANQAYRTASSYQPTGSRYVGVIFVIVLHVVIIYAFVYALGSRAVELLKGPIQVSNIDQPKPKEDEPPPPPPKLDVPPPPFVPPPEVNIQSEAPAAPTAITTVTNKVPTAPAPPAPPAPPKVGKPVGLASRVNTDTYFPPISKRLGEEGTVRVQVLVSAQGAVMECKVSKGSGYDRLDTAACAVARAEKYTPATSSEGQPMDAWTDLPVRFEMH